MIYHQPNHLPDVVRNSINLSSGHFMSVKLRFLRRKRLPAPYGTCQHKDRLESRYEQIICYSTCVQTLVLKSCGCVDYTSYNDFFDLIAKVIPPCLTLKSGKKRLQNNWERVKQIRLDSTAPCLSSRPIPCEDLVYSYDVSNSKIIFGPCRYEIILEAYMCELSILLHHCDGAGRRYHCLWKTGPVFPAY